MRLHSKDANMVVDFYPIKYSDNTISNRIMLKVVTFCNDQQSKRYISKKDMHQEIDNRVYGYGYTVEGFNTDPQLFNSALACAC